MVSATYCSIFFSFTPSNKSHLPVYTINVPLKSKISVKESPSFHCSQCCLSKVKRLIWGKVFLESNHFCLSSGQMGLKVGLSRVRRNGGREKGREGGKEGGREAGRREILPLFLPLLFSFFLFILLLYNTSGPQPFLPLLLPVFPHLPSPSLDPLSSVSLKKRASLQWISTEHSIWRYSNTRHKSSYQGWTRQLGGKKRVPEQTRVRNIPAPTNSSPTKPQAKQL